VKQNHFSPNKCRVMTTVMASGLLLAPQWVGAAGLGNITVHSLLGQPLRAEVQVTATDDELAGMAAHLASQAAFEQANVRYVSALRQLRFTLEKSAGGAVIRVASEKPINDPFMSFMLELSWPSGQLVREYTFLIDPPDRPAKVAGVTPARPQPAVPLQSGTTKAAPAVSAATTQEGEAAAREHVVKSGETLYRIAMENLPDGVTLAQMQAALYRGNPDAFDGSISRLRVGAVLKIPAKAEALAISPDKAQKTRTPQTSVQRKPEQRTVPAEKSLEARKKKIGEFNARVSEMKREVDKLQEKIKSKDEELARIEKLKEERKHALAAADTKTSEVPPVVVPPVVAEEKPVEPETVQSENAQSEVVPPQKEDDVKTAEPPVAEPPPVPSQLAKPSKAPVPVRLDTDTEEEGAGLLTWVLGGAGALIVLVLGFLFLRKRKESADVVAEVTDTQGAFSDAGGPFSQGNPTTKGPSSVFQTDGGQNVNTSVTNELPVSEFSQIGRDEIDTGEVDPVAEADVYMAYGRDGQAEDILLDALHKDPHRLAIYVKLLEVYAGRKDVKGFETLAMELYAQTDGQGAEWEKVVVLGKALNPDNPLYDGVDQDRAAMETDIVGIGALSSSGLDTEEHSDAPAFNLLATDAVAQQSMDSTENEFAFAPEANHSAPVSVDMADQEDDPLLSLLQEEAASGVEDERGVEEAVSVSASKTDVPPDLDFPVKKLESTSPESEVGTISQAILDFDLEKGHLAARDKSANVGVATVVNPEVHRGDADETALSSAAVSMNSGQDGSPGNLIDFELEMPEVVKPAAVHDEMSDDKIAIDADLECDVQLVDSVVLGGQQGGAGFDLSDISLDLETGGATEVAAEPEVLNEPIPEKEVVDQGRDEVNTKLDLARAYEEMGDLEGARELLGEVVSEGAPDQVTEAQAMLTRLNV
jgi:pilus assembly protein FimV